MCSRPPSLIRNSLFAVIPFHLHCRSDIPLQKFQSFSIAMMMPGLSSAQCRSMLLYNRNFFVDYNEEQLDHDPRPDLHTYRRQACPERLNITDEALAYWEYEYLQWWDSVGHKPSSTRIRTIEEFQKIQVIVKRRLEACPRWQIYRDNQVKTYGKSGKGGKAKEEVQKWTDTYERVFIEGD